MKIRLAGLRLMALPTKLTLEIVTPDRSLVARRGGRGRRCRARKATSASCPGTRRCWPRWKSASSWYRSGQEKHYLAIAGGFVEVLPDRVTVLADSARRLAQPEEGLRH